MALARRATVHGTRQLLRQHPRRFASGGSASHPPVPPVKESFGTGFYLFVGVFPLSYLVYRLSQPSSDGRPPYFTRVIDSYSNWEAEWKARNELHTQMFEQAGRDKLLFQGSTPKQTYDLRFPEVFNVGSPYNVPPGHYANVDKVIEKYQNDNRRVEEDRIRRQELKKARATGELREG